MKVPKTTLPLLLLPSLISGNLFSDLTSGLSNLISHQSDRHLLASGIFAANSCAPSTCVKFSDAFPSTTVTSELVVDCSTCITMEGFTNGEVIELQGGLNIIGEMKFPEGVKVHIKTPHIFVQGKLSMSSTAPIDGTPDVKVTLTGTSDVMFVPAVPNAARCPAGGCNMGPKPVVVAGGTLDITGLPPRCPAWSIMEDDGSRILPIAEPHLVPEVMEEGCPYTYFDEDFESGANGWYGNVGAYSDVSEGFLTVSGRRAAWQGPMVEIPRTVRNCLKNDTDLVFYTHIKLSKFNGTSDCATSHTNCPELKYTKMDTKDRVLTFSLASIDPDNKVSDDEWFVFAGTFQFKRYMVGQTDDIFSTLSIMGPEAGVEISIDDFMVGYPPAEAFPDPTEVCRELVPGNGDAELGFTFPFRTYDRSPLRVLFEDGNAFFRVERDKVYSGMAFEFNKDCTPEQSIFSFSAKIRLHSATPTVVRFMVKTFHAGGPIPASIELLTACPESSSEIGWVECKTDFSFEAKHAESLKLEVITVTPDDTKSTLDYDDFKFTFKSGPSGTGLKVVEQAASCWTPGAKVVITSQTINYNDEQVATIKSITADGTIVTNEDVKSPTPSSRFPEFASHFGLLSRNIVFEAAADGPDELIGGHLIFLRTPGAQKLDGVSFENFGQQGVKGRYPIHVYQTGASAAVISRNVIFNSNSRCVVLAGAQGVTVESNVAYNVFGHCYALEDGSEFNNVIRKNFGAKVMRASRNVPLENDHSPGVFLIKNPNNSWEGNVASGSQDSGFWFELDGAITGDSQGAYNINPSTTSIKLFKDNIAHSNMGNGIRTFPKGFKPTVASLMEGGSYFRNRGSGIYFKETQNVIVDGATIADNLIGINVDLADNVIIKNTNVMGYSESFKEKAEAQGTARFCWGASAPLYGVSLHPATISATSNGATLENVKFSRFTDNLGCPGSAGITISDSTTEQAFSAKTNFIDVGLMPGADEEEETLISACAATQQVIHDVKIMDNGFLNPDGAGAGYIVSNNTVMTSIAGICHDIKGSCMQYCYGQCLRKVQIGLDTEGTEDFVLEVDDGNGVTTIVQGEVAGVVGDSWAERRFYTLDAPIGTGKYIAQFKRNGEIDWPIFAEIEIEDEPICSPYWTNFTLIIPPAPEGACDSLVRNGDFDAKAGGSLTQWHHTGGGIKLVPGVTGMALSTVERWSILDGFAQYLDTRCLKKGDIWKFEAMTKLWNPFDMPVCEPNQVPLGDQKCVRGNIKAVPDEGEATYFFDFAVVRYPYEQGKWNSMHGVFQVDDHMANASSVVLYFDGVRDAEEMLIDDVKIYPIEKTCDNIVRNGDFEDGTTMWWRFLGTMTWLLTVDNQMYGETGWSCTTVKRQFYFHGPTQLLNTNCMSEGNWYEVSGRYRLYDGDDIHPCDPYYGYVGGQTCPAIQMRYFYGFNETYYDVGLPIGPYTMDGWNYFYGTFQAGSELMNADKSELFIANSRAYTNIVFDDIVVKEATPSTFGIPSCQQLLQNPDAEIGDARFWKIKGTADYGTIEMVSPGAGGSEYAFHHTGYRKRNFNGLWQYLDQRCMPIGSKWKVSADFKLFDQNGNPFLCDKSKAFGPLVCPQILIQSTTLGTPYHNGPLMNTVGGAWVPDDFNHFEAVFTMNEGHKIEDRTWLFVHNVAEGYTYYVDNFMMERIS